MGYVASRGCDTCIVHVCLPRRVLYCHDHPSYDPLLWRSYGLKVTAVPMAAVVKQGAHLLVLIRGTASSAEWMTGALPAWTRACAARGASLPGPAMHGAPMLQEQRCGRIGMCGYHMHAILIEYVS
jgi:hypothetical protein